ncbi:hypothetical protein [Streptomyces kebangsaanensis]|uniref:hypothetical protein n=1 Tax=Streptomyces kebangsaanensis TaxID=864058 RepID=UPI00093D56F2|nr:hypothetical protein [Streptomyces kebangsaanensis]
MALTTLLLALADRLDLQPNRLADLHAIRGRARHLGLTGEWADLLPEPDGAHCAEYATRLRTLAGGHS